MKPLLHTETFEVPKKTEVLIQDLHRSFHIAMGPPPQHSENPNRVPCSQKALRPSTYLLPEKVKATNGGRVQVAFAFNLYCRRCQDEGPRGLPADQTEVA